MSHFFVVLQVIYEELKSNLEDVENPASETKTAVLPFLAKTKILIDFIQVSSQDMIEDELNRVHPKLEKVKIGKIARVLSQFCYKECCSI